MKRYILADMKKLSSFIIIVLLLILGNFAESNGYSDTFYFSTKLKEDNVLEWEESLSLFSPRRENDTYLVEIAIIQDIPDVALGRDFFYRYFNLTVNGTTHEDRYYINSLVTYYIAPTKYVDGLITRTLYEHYLNKSGEYQNFTLEQDEGYIEVNGTLTADDFYSRFEFIVHEKTGIVKYRYQHFVANNFDFIREITYLGGMRLVSSEFTMVPLVLLGIPIIGTVIRRRKKRKINLP
ncbi:MAG: hypothetical protein ACTSQC_10395 [Candidatus Heimdallarchaeaceae archaeon]